MRRRVVGLAAAGLLAALLLLALVRLEGDPPAVPRQNSTYYMRAVPLDGVQVSQNHTRRALMVDSIIEDFYLPPRDLFNTSFDGEYGRDYGNKGSTVYGVPWFFDEYGSDVFSGFNAWIASAFLVEYERSREPRLLSIAEGVARGIRREFWDPANRSYEMVDRIRGQRGAVNDALIGSLYLQLHELTGNTTYRRWARETFDGLIDNYLPESGELRCCVADGVLRNERLTRDGLTIPSLVYAHRVLGDSRYLQRARAMADHYIAHLYRPEGYFTNWSHPEVSAEIGFGLLELYRIQPQPRYREVLLGTVRYWAPRVVVDSTPVHKSEWYPYHTQVARLFPEADRSILPAVWVSLEFCWSDPHRMYPHDCSSSHKEHSYAVITAIALLGYP
ncbi:MAG: hypothetical protein HY558_03995 [Euryarchaeota archaeon]|nr:hypothetical protein [Euryarchaeota archaeon]